MLMKLTPKESTFIQPSCPDKLEKIRSKKKSELVLLIGILGFENVEKNELQVL